jgi:hypothetical protein
MTDFNCNNNNNNFNIILIKIIYYCLIINFMLWFVSFSLVMLNFYLAFGLLSWHVNKEVNYYVYVANSASEPCTTRPSVESIRGSTDDRHLPLTSTRNKVNNPICRSTKKSRTPMAGFRNTFTLLVITMKNMEGNLYLYHVLTLMLRLSTLINLSRDNSDFLL